MDTINLCNIKINPKLPPEIERDLLFVQMIALEKHLRATNQLFEQNTYVAIMGKLATIYYKINHTYCGTVVYRIVRL